MGKKKGIGFETEEMMKLFLALIIGAGFFVLIVTLSGGLSGLMDKISSLFGGASQEGYYQTAKLSTIALVDAINCVSNPSACDPGFFTPQGRTYTEADFNNPLTGMLIKSETVTQEVTLEVADSAECRQKCMKQYCQNNRYCKCECSLSRSITGTKCECKVTYLTSGPEVKCEKTGQGVSCTVKNFYLPENFAGLFNKAEEYIAGFGDPSFLVYWQRFPPGEDASWEKFSAWYEGVGKLMFLGFCLSHFIPTKLIPKPVSLNKLKRLLRLKGETKAAEEIDRTVEGVESVLKKSGRQGSLKSAENVVIGISTPETHARYISNLKVVESFKDENAFIQAVKKSGRKIDKSLENNLREVFRNVKNAEWDVSCSLAEYLPETEARKLVLKMFGQEAGEALLKSAPKVMKYAGFDSLASYVAALIDSKMSKYKDVKPLKLVLKTPLKEPEAFSLENLLGPEITSVPLGNEKVIILDKNPIISTKFGNKPVTFYLASPCFAELTVENATIKCKYYSYNPKTNGVECIEPEINPNANNLPLCGSINPLYVDKNTDKTMFRDTNGDGKWDVLTLDGKWEESIGFKSLGPNDRISFFDTNYDGEWDKIVRESNDDFLERVTVLDSNYDGELDKITYETSQKTVTIEGKEFEDKVPINKQISIDTEEENGIKYMTIDYITIDIDNPSIDFSSPAVSVIDKDDDSKWDWVDLVGVIFFDTNGDGVWDYAYQSFQGFQQRSDWYKNGFWNCKKYKDDTCVEGSRIVENVVENIGGCVIDGIVVSVKKNDIKGKPNFCYAKDYSGLVGFAAITGSFAVSALAKVCKIGGPLGFVLSSGVDCGLAYLDFKYVNQNWPNG